MRICSIIVPIYNTRNYIDRCIQSIIDQTYADLEIILVDDGSTDDSLISCNFWKLKDDRIHVIHQNNLGATAARNAGLEIASGEYIAFVDSDDWIYPDYITELVNLADRENADVAMCGHYVSQGDIVFVEPINLISGVYQGTDQEIIENLLYIGNSSFRGINLSLWGKLFKKDFFKKHQVNIDPAIRYSEDEICVSECLMDANKIVLTETPLYCYCKRDDSICTSVNQNYFSDISKTFSEWKRIVSNRSNAKYLLKKIDKYYLENIARGVNSSYGFDCGILIPTYLPPYELMSERNVKKIILYGSGFVGQNYWKSIEQTKNLKIVAWVDKQYEVYKKQGFPVDPILAIESCEYDAILIAVEYENVANSIKKELLDKYNIVEDKLIFVKPTKWIDAVK